MRQPCIRDATALHPQFDSPALGKVSASINVVYESCQKAGSISISSLVVRQLSVISSLVVRFFIEELTNNYRRTDEELMFLV